MVEWTSQLYSSSSAHSIHHPLHDICTHATIAISWTIVEFIVLYGARKLSFSNFLPSFLALCTVQMDGWRSSVPTLHTTRMVMTLFSLALLLIDSRDQMIMRLARRWWSTECHKSKTRNQFIGFHYRDRWGLKSLLPTPTSEDRVCGRSHNNGVQLTLQVTKPYTIGGEMQLTCGQLCSFAAAIHPSTDEKWSIIADNLSKAPMMGLLLLSLVMVVKYGL